MFFVNFGLNYFTRTGRLRSNGRFLLKRFKLGRTLNFVFEIESVMRGYLLLCCNIEISSFPGIKLCISDAGYKLAGTQGRWRSLENR
jgi:hypothetical protein